MYTPTNTTHLPYNCINVLIHEMFGGGGGGGGGRGDTQSYPVSLSERKH